MFNILQNGQVLEVIEVSTGTQTATIEKHYDMIYHTVLEYTTGQVKATVYNYLNELQTGFTDSITFDYDGSQVTVVPVNGVATIDFTSAVPGDHVVKTVNPNIRNGEVIIHV
jgi:hypothetical protein